MSVSEHVLLNALAFHEHISERFEAFRESEGRDTIAEKNIADSVRPGLYEHWKSKEGDPKFYIVYGVGCEQDLYTPLVSYTALYAPHAGRLTYRHLLHEERGFLTPIQREEYTGLRFKLVVTLSWMEIRTLVQYIGELIVIESPVSVRGRCRTLLKKSVPFS